MSSDILSRPVDVSKYAMIYGGAQKNIGPAGVTFVIVREDALGKVSRPLPSMVDYRNHIASKSMFNTPPVFAIYVVKETLKWLKSIGGVPEIQKRNKAKADLLYAEIDRNPLFVGTAVKEDRSLMNVCFVMSEPYADLAPESSSSPRAKVWSASRGTVWWAVSARRSTMRCRSRACRHWSTACASSRRSMPNRRLWESSSCTPDLRG